MAKITMIRIDEASVRMEATADDVRWFIDNDPTFPVMRISANKKRIAAERLDAWLLARLGNSQAIVRPPKTKKVKVSNPASKILLG